MQDRESIDSGPRIIQLDALRGIASLIIVIFHTYGTGHLDISENLFFVKNKFGLGVQLFFILSAFSLFLNYHDKIKDNNSIKYFYINRLAKVCPLFIFMIISWVIIRISEWGQITPIHEFIINIFGIFNVFPGLHEGIVWASWALGILFLFYLVVPILIIFIRNIKGAIILTFILLLLSRSSLAVFSDLAHFSKNYAYMNFIFQLPVFGFGILFYFIYKSTKIMNKIFIYAISTIGVVNIFILYFAYNIINVIQGYVFIDFIKSISFYAWTFVLSFLIYSQSLYCIPLFNNAISRFYGKISYSLYLIHPFIIYKLKNIYSIIYSIDGVSKDIAFVGCTIISIIVVTPLAFILYKMIENPGGIYLKKLYRMLNEKNSVAADAE